VQLLATLASLAAARGELVRVAHLWGATEALRETAGRPLRSIERAAYERETATARDYLGETAFAAAWAEGRGITPEQVLAATDPEVPARPTDGLPTRTPVSRSVPEGLTPRQVEVLRLLAAQGLTNRQIAEQLGITAQTVHAHLRSMYSKLGVTTRSAATRYAIEHRLI
jgi:DNA-binding CsgD family transcriptional regulator